MRRVMGDEPGHRQALGQVCCAGRDVLGRTSSLEALSAGWERYDVCAAERPGGSEDRLAETHDGAGCRLECGECGCGRIKR